MKERNKRALKESLVLMGIMTAIFVGATIITLVVFRLMQSSPWLGGAILAAVLILFVGIFEFFISR